MYEPKRDYRFEYVTDAIQNIEDNSCSNDCVHGDIGAEYPSLGCPIIEDIMLEKPREEIDDRGDEGLFCDAYERPLTLVEKLQLPLW